MKLLGLPHARPRNLKQLWVGSHAATLHFFQELGKAGNEVRLCYGKMGYVETALSAYYSLVHHRRHDRLFINQNKLAWQLKSLRAERWVRRYARDTDVVVLNHGLFTPYADDAPLKPYVIFTDYNRALRYRNASFSLAAPWTNEEDREILLGLERDLYQRAAHLFVPSQYLRSSMINDYDVLPERVSVVGYGSPVKHSDVPPKRDWKAQKVIFIGEPKSFERKGGPELMAAFKRVRKELPKASLTLIGPGPDMIGEQPGVAALGVVQDRARLHELLNESTCFVMPSRQEPFGMAFVEAMALHLPVIGACVDAVPEIITHEENGMLIPPGDADTLAESIIEVLSNPDRARDMGEAGFRRMVDRFTWAGVARRVNNVLANLPLNGHH